MKQKKISNFRKSLLFSFFLVLLGVSSISAQSVITGRVTDESGGVIPGANIVIQGTSTGTSTDFNGEYTINANQGDVLAFSFIGYATKTVTVGSNSTINVQLDPDSQNLDEVVVIGYGTAKKSDVTGSVSQVSSKSFEDQPLTRTEDALQGRAAGVAVAKSSGQPGGEIKVRIRGVNSINGNNSPLVVIDGMIGGNLSSINPNDIQSMDVLKDASATAIYGSRGSNGVILVTTKKGRGDTKLNAEYFISFDNVPNYIPTLGAADFARIENSRRIRGGGGAIFTDSEISELEQNGGTNYQKELFQQGITQNVQLSVSGSEGKLNYFLSGNYQDQEGIVTSTAYNKLSLRSNVGVKISDKVKVGLRLFGTRATTQNDINSFNLYQGSMVLRATVWDPTTPVRDENGEYNPFSLKNLASLNYNPIADMNESIVEVVEDRLESQFEFSWDILENFSYQLLAGGTTTNRVSESYQTSFTLPDAFYNGGQSTYYQVSNILNWRKNWNDKHDLNVTGVYEFSKNQYKGNSYSAIDLEVPNGFYLAELASGQSIGNAFNESSIQSAMARAAYVYNESLYLTATIRMDQSSRFREDNRTGWFPSFAAKYSFKNQDFIADSNTLSDFGLRAGWGQVGNQNIPIYSTYPSVNANSYYTFDGGTRSPGSSPAGYGNPDLTWETTSQINIGADLAFWDGRANFSLDWYKKNTRDLLLNEPVPNTLGGGSITKNLGEVENNGFDISLGGKIIDHEKFTWDSNVSFSHVKNKVVDLGGQESIQGNFESTDGKQQRWNIIEVGEPLGQFQGATFLGTWKTAEATEAAIYGRIPGDAKYLRDENGDVVFDVIGNGTPTTFWGFNNTLTWGNWDANVFFQGSHGFDIYNAAQGIVVGATGNQRSFLAPEQLNQWTAANETEVPAGGDNIVGSSRFVEKGGFVRLQNLTIGYTLRDLGSIKSLKFYAAGQNLFLITDYSGYDPEHTSRAADGSGNGDTAAGINVGAYPNPRTFTLGFKLGF